MTLQKVKSISATPWAHPALAALRQRRGVMIAAHAHQSSGSDEQIFGAE
jgi:hypothetical protein